MQELRIYLLFDNYSGMTSNEFVSFGKARRIGLMKSKLSEFNALQNMPHLEHIGIGYNSKMESISWLKDNKSLTSVAFQNCKKIKRLGDTWVINKHGKTNNR